jgi:hypothetical protein
MEIYRPKPATAVRAPGDGQYTHTPAVLSRARGAFIPAAVQSPAGEWSLVSFGASVSFDSFILCPN